MILTEGGFWFSIQPLDDGLVDYEICRYDVRLDHGIATEEEMLDRFDALCEAASRPLC